MIIRSCVVCRIPADMKRNAKTCSPECGAKLKKQRLESARAERRRATKICVICGVEFSGHGTRIVCSPNCKNIRKGNLRRLKPKPKPINAAPKVIAAAPPRACVVCGGEFSGHGRRIFCSVECGRKRQLKPRACPVCEADMTGFHGSKIYCTEVCRRRHLYADDNPVPLSMAKRRQKLIAMSAKWRESNEPWPEDFKPRAPRSLPEGFREVKIYGRA